MHRSSTCIRCCMRVKLCNRCCEVTAVKSLACLHRNRTHESTGGTDAIKAIEPSLQSPGGGPLLALSAWLTLHTSVREHTPALQDPQTSAVGGLMGGDGVHVLWARMIPHTPHQVGKTKNPPTHPQQHQQQLHNLANFNITNCCCPNCRRPHRGSGEPPPCFRGPLWGRDHRYSQKHRRTRPRRLCPQSSPHQRLPRRHYIRPGPAGLPLHQLL